MKIAVASNSDDIDAARVARLGTCSHLLLVDSETMECDAIPISPADQGRGAGIRMVTLAAGHGAEAIMTTYVPPRMEAALHGSGIDLVAGVEGTVRGAIEEYAGQRLRGTYEESAPLTRALQQSFR